MSNDENPYSYLPPLSSHLTPKNATPKQATAIHQHRSVSSDAVFVLPYIKKTDQILDIGCGSGTITLGFREFVPAGSVTGIDAAEHVINRAKQFAAELKVAAYGPGSVKFQQASVNQTLPFPDNTFDIVYSCQVFGAMPMKEQPLRALGEARRVLKHGGILATRDAASEHIYPSVLKLDRLWIQRLPLTVPNAKFPLDPAGPNMASLVCRAGFDYGAGKVKIVPAASSITSPEDIKSLAKYVSGQLAEGSAVRQSWLNAGVSPGEIGRTLSAVEKLTQIEGAWCMAMHCQVLAWK